MGKTYRRGGAERGYSSPVNHYEISDNEVQIDLNLEKEIMTTIGTNKVKTDYEDQQQWT